MKHIMEQVIISTSITENGFNANCELLPEWFLAFSGNFSEFVQHVRDSIDAFVNAAKTDHKAYPDVFDTNYELLFKMDFQGTRGTMSLSYRDV